MYPPRLPTIKRHSITAGASPASTILAHDELPLLQIGLGHPADTGGLVIGILFDHTRQAA